MIKYYSKDKNCIVCIDKEANNSFWDGHWQDNNFEKRLKVKSDRLVLGITDKYLSPGAKILEGGCGQGDKVYALHYHGYDVYGVDYAVETVNKINKFAPELKVKCADVKELPFEDGCFDGYWSLGVIEHFYNGYSDVLDEMKRVIAPGGFLFLTVPIMSPLRRLKSILGVYPKWKECPEKIKDFYQFILDENRIIASFENNGFKKIETKSLGGVKGVKDEVSFLKPFLQNIYDSKSTPVRMVRKAMDVAFRCFANHIELFVMQKENR